MITLFYRGFGCKKYVYIINIVHYIGVEKMIDIESFIGDFVCQKKLHDSCILYLAV